MNILELDSYNLADAVKFNDQLNPRIWSGQKMRPEVRDKLLEIAADFKESLGLNDLNVEDITVSGSNAGFTYTPHSDIDLHLVVRMPEQCDEVYQELFNAKKYQYNDEHDIRIGGHDVELYVQPADQPHVSAGVYSLKDNDWIHIPRQVAARVDDESVRNKYEDIKARIESALKSQNIDNMRRLWLKIKDMRKSGLAQNGELGPENLAFKMLRTQGILGQLKDEINRARDAELSLTERRKKKKKSRVKYGFGGYWYPGFGFGSGEGSEGGGDGGGEGRFGEDATLTPDGVNPTTKMFLSEKDIPSHTEIIFDFMRFAVHELELKNVPTLKIKKDPQWSVIHKSFGRYRDDLGQIELAVGNRHIMDVLRTLGHELQHRKQDEREHMPPEAGKTGSPYENEAHAVAGVLMRRYADLHPEYFEDVPLEENVEEGWKEKAGAVAAAACIAGTPGCATTDIGAAQTAARAAQTMQGMTRQGVRQELDQELRNYIRAQGGGPGSANAQNLSRIYQLQKRQQQNENASGYIPTAKEKNDPRYKMALTVDIKPGQVGREANKLALQTDKQGKPALLIKSANLLESSLAEELQKFKQSKHHGFGSTPISQVPGEQEDDLGNQEATGPEFPPQMPAGTTKIDVSDLTDWYRLGMDISDLDDADPADYNQGPPQTVVVFPSDEAEQGYLKQFKRLGLKTHDIDPDVEGGEDIYGKHLNKKLAEELKQFKEQDLFEINMSPSNLEKLVNQINALAGMEFEMIVPDVGNTDEPGDLEPNYDEDSRVRSLSDIEDFFYDGDFNGRGDVRRLLEQIEQEYEEWLFESMSEAWSEQGLEAVLEYVRDNLDSIDGADDLLAQARDEIEEANPELDSGSDEFNDIVQQRFKELVDEWAEQEYQNDTRLAEQVREQFEEDYRQQNDIDEWVSNEYPRMTDIDGRFEITWPHWESTSDGQVNVEEVADDFSRFVGTKVNWSSNYHGAKRQPDRYVVEPDGSLNPDDDNDAGLEFVSPPLPLDRLLDDLYRVRAWANNRDCYTNESTGLHINVSVPGLTTANLDYVKLALLLGDKYVLDQFDRLGNTYAKSAMDIVKERVAQRPEDAATLLNKMKQGLDQLATKVIHSGETNKYTSINTKGGYVEFRSPGGDWLSDEFFNKIKPTLLRFVVALDAAMDPEKYREEYLKKLYQLLQPKSGTDTLSYFAKYAAGELPKAALKSFVRQAQLERKYSKEPKGTDNLYWWQVSVGAQGIQVVAANKFEAWQKAVKEVPEWSNVPGIRADISVLRPYESQPTAPTLGGRPSNPDGNWLIVDRNRRPVYRFMAADRRNAETVWLQYSREHHGTYELKYDPDRELNQSPQAVVPRRAQGDFTGEWKIVDDAGREVHRFSGVGNAQADANRVAMQYLQRNGNPNVSYSVVPVMR